MFRHRTTRIAASPGVTILEVLASAVLIFLGLGAVFSLNAQSLQILRKARQAATASQMLQERIESMRKRSWGEISRAQPLATWWRTPSASAPDLQDASPTETVVVSPAASPGSGAAGAGAFEVERRDGGVAIIRDADLSGERLLLVELRIQWRDQQRHQERRLRTIVGRAGLTRSGIFGSAVGRIGVAPTTLSAP